MREYGSSHEKLSNMEDRERKPELYDKYFNSVIDRYLFQNTVDPDAYEQLTDLQKDVVQVINRAFERFNRRKNGTRESTAPHPAPSTVGGEGSSNEEGNECDSPNGGDRQAQ